MTKIIGLTGGIGSGKTMLAKHLLSLGIPVYIADDEAKKILNSKEVHNEILMNFGQDILQGHSKQIDTKKLAAIVFGNKEKLEKLNAILHPKVNANFKEWLQNHQSSILVVKEAAILFESGSYKDCDYIITVIAPIQIRIERVLKRDNTTIQKINERMTKQWSDEQRIIKSDFVIENIDQEKAKKEIEQVITSIIKSIK